MAKFLSGRIKELLLGVVGYTENNTVLQTTGKVGIGTTNAQQHSLFVVGSTNITGDTIVGGGFTAVGIGSFQNDVYIDQQLYVDGITIGEDISARNLYLSGIATVTDLTDLNGGLEVTGVSTFASDVDINASIDVDGHTELDNVNVSGTATITSLDVQTNFDVYDSTATFHNNVHITGNLSIGGTTTVLQAQDLQIFDKDIILGVTTDSNGNDISTDITANHAGVAVASTEGNPLVDLYLEGLEELPTTYKKIMWFSEGSFSGLGTDAWLYNYAVGIGSTQFPSGTRLAAGQIRISEDTINTPNLDVSRHTELDTLNTTGISTFGDRVIFDSTNSIQIPSGTTAERDVVGVAVTGQIRYNSEYSTFEGFGPGNAWGSLGGVKDVNQDTYIIPEVSPGSNEDTLYFYTGGFLSATISSEAFTINVPIGIGTDFEVTGITTFTNITDNILGDPDTGAVQIDGGLGVNKNVTVGAGLSVVSGFNVAGLSTFQDNVRVSTTDSRLYVGQYKSPYNSQIELRNINSYSYLYHYGTGPLHIALASGGNKIQFDTISEVMCQMIPNGPVNLYYDNSKKFETTGAGVTVFGTAFSNQLNISGVSTFQDDVIFTSATSGLGVFYDRSADTLKLLEDGSNNTKLTFGDNTTYSSYMQIYHDGGNSGIGYINYAGSNKLMLSGNQIAFFNKTRSEVMLSAVENNGVFLYYDNSLKFQTTGAGVTVFGTAFSNQLNISGVSTFQDNVNLGDNNRIRLGDSNDLQIYHNGANSWIQNTGSGNLKIAGDEVEILSAAGASKITATTGGSVDLYHNAIKRLETTGIGVSIYDDLNVGTGVTIYGNAGIVSAISFYGDGSNLTNTGATLNASSGTQRLVLTSLTSGTMINVSTDGDLTFNADYNLLSVPSINVSTAATFGGTISAGGTIGTNNQYLKSTGVGVTWSSFPTLRTTQNNIASDGQTVFPFTYNVNYIDVYVNGVKLAPSEYIATSGGQVVLISPAFEGDIVELISYNTTTSGGDPSFATKNVETHTATANQTTFTGTYAIGFVDVYLNGAKLSEDQYTATSGSDIILDTGATAGDIVEVVGLQAAVESSGGGTGFATKRISTHTAIASQTSFGGDYTPGYVDVYLNGAKLSEDEYTATSGTNIVLDTAATAGDIVEVVGLQASLSVIGVTIQDEGSSLTTPATALNFVGDGVVASGSGATKTITISGGGSVGAGGTWATDAVGINTTKSVGIGTTAKSGYSLYVEGDARVTGILTVGPASVTIDGINNEVSVGAGITLYGNTGIISATSLNVTGALSGDGSSLTGLTGASANTYGNGTAVPQITVDANGRITGISNVLISGGGGGGSSLIINDSDSLVGVAGTINFGTGLSVSPVSVGIVTVTVDGTELTSLNASQLSSGTVPDARFPATLPAASGVNLTSLNASNLGSGTIPDARFPSSLPAIDGSALTGIGVTVAGTWTLESGDGTDYTISGPGLDGSQLDPTIYVRRGQVYQFVNSTGGHPFQIQYEGGNTGGTAYNDGIINNNANSGTTLHWNVQNDAPDVLYYQCTAHTNMWGKIIVLGDVVSEGSWTATAGVLENIDTIIGVANNDFKTAEYTLHIEHASGMQAQKVLSMQTGSTAYSQEFAIMYDNNLLVSIGASISGGNFHLNATPESGISGITTYRFTRQTIR